MEYYVECPNCESVNILNIEEKEFIIQFNCRFCGYLMQFDGKKVKREPDILVKLEEERRKWRLKTASI
ncbi:MAG: hypothetical protein QW290_09310 [Sulfolobales archaeon]